MKRAPKLKLTAPAPTEHREQADVVRWANEMVQWKKWPELGGLYAIPNGVKLAGDYRSRAISGARLRAEGLRSGIPDLCLPIARRGFHALYIEMKSNRKGAEEGPLQGEWRRFLNSHGNHAVVCYGAREAIDKLIWYVTYGGDEAHGQ